MRCLIVEDHPVTLLGLQLVMQHNFPESEVVSAPTVRQANELLDRAGGKAIDIVILEIMLVGHTGVSALMHLKHALLPNDTPCMIFSSVNNHRTINLCKELGAHGYVSKNTPEALIIHAIKTICAGGRCFYTEDSKSSDMLDCDMTKLSARQKDVLELVLAGYSNKKIANTLKLSYGTVKNYMFNLMRLLNVNSRLELAVKLGKTEHQSHTMS